MLAGIEFGLLHLFPHRVNAFKDVVYFSNGETLFPETFIRFLPVPLTSLSKKIGLQVRLEEERHGGLPVSEGFRKQRLLVLPRQGRVTGCHFLLCVLTSTGRGATGARVQREKSGP